jgi:L-asparaginase II
MSQWTLSEDRPLPPLIAVRRGPLVEALHRGAVVVADGQGRVVAHVGDPEHVTYMRSSAKPLQLLAMVESGAADRFGFAPEELACMAGSHSGSRRHVETVARSLARLGLDASALACGVHPPFDPEEQKRLQAEGLAPSPLHNNCSGKHTGMLALAQHRGWPTEGYERPDHPVQVRIREVLAQMAGFPAEEIVLGTDGCSVPVHALPLRAAATAFARLVDPQGLPPSLAEACRRVVAAMVAHPEMVAGEGRLCTLLMRAWPGRLVAKAGAEGYYAVGILPGALGNGNPGLGLVVKLEDGDGRRGRDPALLEALRLLGVYGGDLPPTLAPLGNRPLTNHRGLTVGTIETTFTLDWEGVRRW